MKTAVCDGEKVYAQLLTLNNSNSIKSGIYVWQMHKESMTQMKKCEIWELFNWLDILKHIPSEWLLLILSNQL